MTVVGHLSWRGLLSITGPVCFMMMGNRAYVRLLTFVLSAVRRLDRSASSNTTYLMNSPQSTKKDACPTRNPCVNDHRDDGTITGGVGVGVARMRVDAVAMFGGVINSARRRKKKGRGRYKCIMHGMKLV